MFFLSAKELNTNKTVESKNNLSQLIFTKRLFGVVDKEDFYIQINNNDFVFYLKDSQNKNLFEFLLESNKIFNKINLLYIYSNNDDITYNYNSSFIIDFPKPELIYDLLTIYLPPELISYIIDFIKIKIKYRIDIVKQNTNYYIARPKLFIPKIFN